MSIEDPGEADRRPATPAWPPAVVRGEAVSTPTPERADAGDEYDEVGEEFEQFDWDSWQPGAVVDDGPVLDAVDWNAVAAPVEQKDPASWRAKVIGESAWPRGITVGEREPLPDAATVQAPPSASGHLLDEEDDDLEPVPTSFAEPLLASGKGWPPASAISHDVVHVRVAPWAPFTTGLALAVAMVLVSAAILSQTGRLGLTLAVLTGQVPTSADAVVAAYLGAISRGDATKAASYLSAVPPNALLLTDSVLQRSNGLAPFTIVSVKAGSNDINGTQRVTATYRIGDVQVDTAFTTAYSEGQWVIRDDPGRIGVGSLRASGIPMFINGAEVPATIDSLPAFPGTYELATQSALIAYTTPSTLVVRSSDEAPIIGAVRLELTTAGREASLNAAKAAVSACLAKKELQPAGCPQNIEPNRNEPVLPDSIVYTVKTESSTISETDLRLSSVSVTYVATWQLDVQVSVDGTARDVPFTFKVTALWLVTLSGTRPSAALKT